MQITLRIGPKTVDISSGYIDHEDNSTWTEVMDELVFPALRGFGYVIDESWSSEIGDAHRDYIAEKALNK